MSTVEIEDDNESITIVVETTVGACGLDPSTDGSADQDQPVRLMWTVQGDDAHRGSMSALGQNLDATNGPIDLTTPRWLFCVGVRSAAVIAMIERLLPWAAAFATAAHRQLRDEREASDEHEWLAVMDRRSGLYAPLARDHGARVP